MFADYRSRFNGLFSEHLFLPRKLFCLLPPLQILQLVEPLHAVDFALYCLSLRPAPILLRDECGLEVALLHLFLDFLALVLESDALLVAWGWPLDMAILLIDLWLESEFVKLIL